MNPTSVTYNAIYERLVVDSDDLVGAFAYLIYKQQKIEFCKTTSGGNPSSEEIDRFHTVASLETSIDGYRLQGQEMAESFLVEGISDFVMDAENQTRQDVLFTHIENVGTGLKTQLTTVNETLDAKRTWAGWIRDVGGNLMVNVVTILVIGVLVLGYKFIGELQQTAEIRAGLGSESVLVDSAADS